MSRNVNSSESVLGIKNLSFVERDAMRITEKKYGSFPMLFLLWAMYRLETPFKFLENIAGLCNGFMLLDTHVASRQSRTGDWTPRICLR